MAKKHVRFTERELRHVKEKSAQKRNLESDAGKATDLHVSFA